MEVGEQLVVETRAAWQAWLDEHNATSPEIWLVSYRRSAKAHSLAHAAACEEALCYGWAAGPTAMLDGDSYATRFAPRAPGASWSDARPQPGSSACPGGQTSRNRDRRAAARAAH